MVFMLSVFGHFYFFIIMVLFLLFSFLNFSWNGTMLFFDMNNFVFLVFMSLIMLGLIVLSEKNNTMLMLSCMLIFISLLFFFSSNVLMLYMYFELSMFPIIIMILGFGFQVEKIGASYYLMFYASLCSFPFLYFYFNNNFFLINYVYNVYSWEMIFIIVLCFTMKFPVYFLHLWLPKAHVEAPTTASMLLAGLLLKLGTMGFYRLLNSLVYVSVFFIIFISFLGMLLGSFICILQSDAKSLAAYSSIAHMGLLLIGFSIISIIGKSSSVIIMISHGFTSTLMFYFIGEFYHSVGSRMIYFFNSFMNISMIMSIFFIFVFLSNMGVPPSLSFFSEFMIIVSNMHMINNFLFFLFIYFMFSFYYSLYFISNCLSGKNWYFLYNWNVGFSFSISFMMYNVVLFIILL